jgi:hypothetical protein
MLMPPTTCGTVLLDQFPGLMTGDVDAEHVVAELRALLNRRTT